MDLQDFMRLCQIAIETTVFVCAPILIIGLVSGLIVSIFQAATQINDSSLAFIPKMGGAVAGLMICGHFMVNRIATFTAWVFNQIPNVVA